METKLAYGLPEVAEAAGVSLSSIRRAINAGELRAVKRGHRTLVTRQDAIRWVENLPAISPGESRAAAA